jgi:predicted MFS family arabinose efflux permease
LGYCERRTTAFLAPFYVGVVIGGVVVSGLSYLIPVYLKLLGYGGSEIGLGGTLMAVPYILITFLMYPTYSKFRNTRIYSSSALLTSSAVLIILLTKTLPAIYLAQIILGASLAIYYPVAEIIIAKLYSPSIRARIYGLFGASWSIGYLVGPSLSGVLLDSAGIQTTLNVLFLLSISSFLSLFFFKADIGMDNGYSERRIFRGLYLFLAATLIFSGMTAIIISVLPGIAKGAGYEASFIGYSYSLFSLSRLVGFLLVSRANMRPTLGGISLTALGSALPLLVMINVERWILLPAVLSFLGILVSLFNSLTYLYMTNSLGGDPIYLISMYEFNIGIGFFITPIIAGVIADSYGAAAMIIFSMTLCIAAGLAVTSIGLLSRRSSSQS